MSKELANTLAEYSETFLILMHYSETLLQWGYEY